jgi:hypothetical protein
LAAAPAFATPAKEAPKTAVFFFNLAPKTITAGSPSSVQLLSTLYPDKLIYRTDEKFKITSAGIVTIETNFDEDTPATVTRDDITLVSGTPSGPHTRLDSTGYQTISTTPASKVSSSSITEDLAAGTYYVRTGFVVPRDRYASFDVVGTISAAPEPATWALMFLGVGFVGAMLRYGRKDAGQTAIA